MVMPTISVHICFEPFAQGVNDADADSVQAAGNFVAIAVKLAPRVQCAEDNFKCAFFGLFVLLYRDAASVVLDGAAAVSIDLNEDFIAEAGDASSMELSRTS